MSKKINYIVLLFILVPTLWAAYPEKPITFIVHSKPGSAIDITTRRLTQIAAKYSPATFLVENKTGGSGIVAMREALSRKADGYTVLAVTKSFISTALLTKGGVQMDDFDFLACVVIDPEVLITNRHSKVRTLEDIISDALAKKGRQKWLGPLVGGVDHLMALKTWDLLGIHGEWIPFEGGSDALAALMGKHGAVYVGNPVDVKGRPDLMLAAVAAKNRLAEFPDTPTFSEKGFALEEVLWRGYALKKGTRPQAVAYLTRLFQQVTQDSGWVQFIRATAAQPVLLTHKPFTDMVRNDQKQAVKYLQAAGILSTNAIAKSAHSGLKAAAFLGLFLLIAAISFFFKRDWFKADILIPLFLIILSLYLYTLTGDFPSGKLSKTAGPAAMPRLWLYGLLFFNGWLLAQQLKSKAQDEPVSPNRGRAVGLAGFMVVYLTALPYLGYYVSTFIFLITGSYLLRYRKHWLIVGTAAGFTALSYLVFNQVLQVPLPLGIWG